MGYDDGFFWCDKCFKENQENEDLEPEYFLPICNSPRMGICGYDGSQSASSACPRQKMGIGKVDKDMALFYEDKKEKEKEEK